jgi:DNA-binding LytR/AlgR family response regulator
MLAETNRETPKLTTLHQLLFGPSSDQVLDALIERLDQYSERRTIEEAHLTRTQLQKRWKCSPQTIDQRIKAGDLKVLRLGRTIRIPITEVLRFEKANTF